MVEALSRRGVLQLSALAAGAIGTTALVSQSPATALALPSTGALAAGSGDLMIITLTPSGAAAVATNDDQLILRLFSPGTSPTDYVAVSDAGAFPDNFVPAGMAVSGDDISIFGGEWVTTTTGTYDRGTGTIPVPAVAASTTIQTSASTEADESRKLRPVTYQYSTTAETLTRIDPPTVSSGDQALFLETLLPGAASIIGVIDEEDPQSVRVMLALWGLDGSLLTGALIGTASALEDLILPIGSGSLFSMVQSTDASGAPKVTPTLLGLLPLSLASKAGSLVASSRTATGSTAVLDDGTGALHKWAPLTGWTAISAPTLSGGEQLTGIAGGSPDPVFAAVAGNNSFRLVTI